MNSNIHFTTAGISTAKKPSPPPVGHEQQSYYPSSSSATTNGSVTFSFGSHIGTAMPSSTIGNDFFQSPITTAASSRRSLLFNNTHVDEFGKSDSLLAPAATVTSQDRSGSQKTKKTRKVRATWSTKEDEMLKQSIAGLDAEKVDWVAIANKVDGRTTKQCRDRWLNYLRPGIVKGNWTSQEEVLIKDMYQTFGPKWCAMSKMMSNRSENDIKNKFNSMLRKEKRKQGKKTEKAHPASASSFDLSPFDYQAVLRDARICTEEASGTTNTFHDEHDAVHSSQQV